VAENEGSAFSTYLLNDYPTDRLFEELQVPTFKNLYIKNSIIQIIKEKDKYKFLTVNRTRLKYVFPYPKLNTSFAQLHYTYQGRLFFNRLPEEIRSINDKTKILNSVKKYFKDKLTKIDTTELKFTKLTRLL